MPQNGWLNWGWNDLAPQRETVFRLRHNDRLAVPRTDFVVGAALNPLALPVEIIDLQLHKFHFRVLRQNSIQTLGIAVIRKAGAL